MAPQVQHNYVLLTSVHNEEAYIERTLQSVVAQVQKPVKWVVVCDRSTDQTEEIVERYLRRYDFIELLRIREKGGFDFAAKVNALNVGYQHLRESPHDFVGILDGDIGIAPDYYSRLLEKFDADSRLGLAGGFVYEEADGAYRSRSMNRVTSVAGAIQLFRRECYEAIGLLQPLKYGGEDWCAEITARMKGWKVEAFPDLKVFHHRPTGTGGGLLQYWFRQGKMDYSIGTLPSFEILKCLRRLREAPFMIGAFARLTAFWLSYCVRAPRLMPSEFVDYLRKEQIARLRDILHAASYGGFAAHKKSCELVSRED
jgi:GT2 family glycosyltransferase